MACRILGCRRRSMGSRDMGCYCPKTRLLLGSRLLGSCNRNLGYRTLAGWSWLPGHLGLLLVQCVQRHLGKLGQPNAKPGRGSRSDGWKTGWSVFGTGIPGQGQMGGKSGNQSSGKGTLGQGQTGGKSGDQSSGKGTPGQGQSGKGPGQNQNNDKVKTSL